MCCNLWWSLHWEDPMIFHAILEACLIWVVVKTTTNDWNSQSATSTCKKSSLVLVLVSAKLKSFWYKRNLQFTSAIIRTQKKYICSLVVPSNYFQALLLQMKNKRDWNCTCLFFKHNIKVFMRSWDGRRFGEADGDLGVMV